MKTRDPMQQRDAAEGQGIQSLAQIRLTQKTKAGIRIHYHSTTRGEKFADCRLSEYATQ